MKTHVSRRSKLIPQGKVSDMVFISYKDRNYNLVISKNHDIAKYGVPSEREVCVHIDEVKQTEEHRNCKLCTAKILYKSLRNK